VLVVGVTSAAGYRHRVELHQKAELTLFRFKNVERRHRLGVSMQVQNIKITLRKYAFKISTKLDLERVQ
jgi:hypothetical protein